MKVLVTGAKGFMGQNVCQALLRTQGMETLRFDINSPAGELERRLAEADYILHLAGVNRPESEEEFETGNAGLTGEICGMLERLGRAPGIAFASSIQVELDNPYGRSKLRAEEILREFSEKTGASVTVFRLKNVFGKWCRPDYNSVVATFCHNTTRDLPITISDENRTVDLVYVDDVVSAFSRCLTETKPGFRFAEVSPSFRVTLGALAETLRGFRESRKTLLVPEFSDEFTRKLYATWLSYMPDSEFDYELVIKTDERGSLAEFIKSPHIGQIFVSRTEPGVTRGNHYHDTKTEKFLVVSGEAIIRFRDVRTRQSLLEYHISGDEFRVVDIPPGYTHSIQNVGRRDLIVIFWASEIFNPESPDTCFEEVLGG